MPQPLNQELSKRAMTKKNNYKKLLEAAKSAFIQQGYETTTIRDIIRSSGLAAGTFYNYFPDKESIFRAIVDKYLLDLSQQLKKKRQAADSLQTYVEPTFLIFFKHIADNSELYRLSRRNETVLCDFYHSSLMEIIWQELISDIDEAVTRSIIPQIEAKLLAASFIGLGHELARLLINDKSYEPEEMAKFASSVFIGGLAHYQKNNNVDQSLQNHHHTITH